MPNWDAVLGEIGPLLAGLAVKDGGQRAALMRGFQEAQQQITAERQQRAGEEQRRRQAGSGYAMDIFEKLQGVEDPDQFYQLRELAKRQAPSFGLDPAEIDQFAYPESKKLQGAQKEAQAILEKLVKFNGPEVIDAHVTVPFRGRDVTPNDLKNIIGMKATDQDTGQPYARPKPQSELPKPGSAEDYVSADPTRRTELDTLLKQFNSLNDPAVKPEKPADPLDQVIKELRAANLQKQLNAPAGGGAKEPNPNQQFSMEERLAKAWTSASQSSREVDRQLSIMQTGLDRFRTGDKNGGSQSVLVTFQKILDPTSVVRESEYARTTEGQALLNRIEGYATRLSQGGTTLTDGEMAAMVETARQFSGALKRHTAGQRRRIEAQAKQYKLNPAGIFDDVLMGEPAPSDPAKPPASGDVEEWVRDANGKLVRKR